MTRRQLQALISQIPEDAEILVGGTNSSGDDFVPCLGAALFKDIEGEYILWGVESEYEVRAIENEYDFFSEWVGKTGIPEE